MGLPPDLGSVAAFEVPMSAALAGPTHAPLPSSLIVSTCVLLTAFVLVLVLAPEQHTAPVSQPTAAQAERAASLARGAAWIWPSSNGPPAAPGAAAPYREAAVLVESLLLRAEGVEHGGRKLPLHLPTGVRLLPVVHVEAAADSPAAFTAAQRAAVIAAVRRQASLAANGAGMLQLDFEAPARQHEAYRALVAAVREALPAGVQLSVTALAHWCTQGDWLDRLPVDEVVPMLYRLGPHAPAWRRRFEQADPALASRCRGLALGFATNDPPPTTLLVSTPRPYWFDETAWTNPSYPPVHLIP
jgi:hypothetical protein